MRQVAVHYKTITTQQTGTLISGTIATAWAKGGVNSRMMINDLVNRTVVDL